MKKTVLLLLCALLVMCLPASAAQNTQSLLQARAAILFVGGKRVGNMNVGADARMQFEFVDRTLADKIYSDPSEFPDAILWNAEYIYKANRQKSNLVILVYTANRSWNFDPEKVTVNGEPLVKSRYYSNMLSHKTGRLSQGDIDTLAFGVPRAQSRPGSKIVFGYEDYTTEFIVPAK